MTRQAPRWLSSSRCRSSPHPSSTCRRSYRPHSGFRDALPAGQHLGVLCGTRRDAVVRRRKISALETRAFTLQSVRTAHMTNLRGNRVMGRRGSGKRPPKTSSQLSRLGPQTWPTTRSGFLNGLRSVCGNARGADRAQCGRHVQATVTEGVALAGRQGFVPRAASVSEPVEA